MGVSDLIQVLILLGFKRRQNLIEILHLIQVIAFHHFVSNLADGFHQLLINIENLHFEQVLNYLLWILVLQDKHALLKFHFYLVEYLFLADGLLLA